MSDVTEKSSNPRDPNQPELSAFELDLLRKLFSNPRIWPDTAKVWIADYVSQNLLLPIGQLQGFTQFAARSNTVATSETRTSTTYGDLATVGPTLTGLSDGTYLIFFGATVFYSGVAVEGGRMSIAKNGAAASEDDRLVVASSVNTGTHAMDTSTTRVILAALSNGGNNAVTAKYRTNFGNSVAFYNRWLVALRVSN